MPYCWYELFPCVFKDARRVMTESICDIDVCDGAMHSKLTKPELSNGPTIFQFGLQGQEILQKFWCLREVE